MSSPAPAARKWYQVPMMWLVLGIPLASVFGGVVMLTLAVNNDDGLVVDDYYKDGMEINRVLDRDRKAAELGLKAQFSMADRQLQVRLFSNGQMEYPESLEFSMLNATRQGLDRTVIVREQSPGIYSAPFDAAVDGRWYLTLGTTDWRISGSMVTPGDNAGMLLATRD